jgi:hypothetical protein
VKNAPATSASVTKLHQGAVDVLSKWLLDQTYSSIWWCIEPRAHCAGSAAYPRLCGQLSARFRSNSTRRLKDARLTFRLHPRLDVQCRYEHDPELGAEGARPVPASRDPSKERRHGTSIGDSPPGQSESGSLQLEAMMRAVGVNWQQTLDCYFSTVHHVRALTLLPNALQPSFLPAILRLRGVHFQ